MSGVPPRIADGLDGPVRVTALQPEDLDAEQFAVIDGIRIITGYPADAPVHPFFLTLARSPAIFSAFTTLGIQAIGQTAFTRRQRELLILRTGWLCDGPYQWGEHVHTGREAGLTDAEIEAVKVGSTAPGWAASDRALLLAAEELVADKTIGAATWALLAGHFDDRRLIELPIIVGHYTMTAYLQNALRFAPNRNAAGVLLDEDAFYGRAPAA